MGAAAPFLDLFAAEHPPDLLASLRALYERRRHGPATQAPARARPALAVAAQQVDVDRLTSAATLRQPALQRLVPEEQE
jgi:hypothetical protein